VSCVEPRLCMFGLALSRNHLSKEINSYGVVATPKRSSEAPIPFFIAQNLR
jgi:hypothetical protein